MKVFTIILDFFDSSYIIKFREMTYPVIKVSVILQ